MMIPALCLGCYDREGVAGGRWCHQCGSLWPAPIREAAEFTFAEDADPGEPQHFATIRETEQAVRFYAAIVDSPEWVRLFRVGLPTLSVARAAILTCGTSNR